MPKLFDPPKGVPSDALRGPNGFWYRLRRDEGHQDKLEDRWPLNTFLEIYLAVIALGVVGIFVALLALLTRYLSWNRQISRSRKTTARMCCPRTSGPGT